MCNVTFFDTSNQVFMEKFNSGNEGILPIITDGTLCQKIIFPIFIDSSINFLKFNIL